MKYIITFLLLSILPCISQAQDLLSYRLKPGEVFTVKQQAEQVITQKMDDTSHKITNTITGMMEFKVMEIVEHGYEISMTFKDLKMLMVSSQHGQLLNVNAKEVVEGDPQSRIFNSLLEVPIRLQLARNGKVIHVVGGDSLVKRMVYASEVEDEFTLKLMEKSLEKEFGSEALSESYEQMTYFYPSRAISIGESWENEFSGKLSAKNKWTLDQLSATTANISGLALVSISMNEPATSMELSGTQITKITTDRLSGFITEMLVESTTEGISTLAQLGDLEIPTSITSTITYQLIQ